MRKPKVTFVIMAGGKGERLWPLVRSKIPKVCLSVNGKHSLIQQTMDRLKPVASDADWLIVTTRGQEGPIRKAIKGGKKIRILVEPEGKNTAACIALAAIAVASREPNRVMVAVPADHWMGDIPAFRNAMRSAIIAAEKQDALVMIGVAAKSARTGLGYLCTAASTRNSQPSVFNLKRFIEKPRLAQAKTLVKQAGTFWNSGMFIARARYFVKLINQRLPEHARLLASLGPLLARQQEGSALFKRKIRSAYNKITNVSFDSGVAQHLKQALVIDGRFAWEDLGSWDIWSQLGRSASNQILVDSQNVSVIGQPGHLVATIGMRNMVVVHTDQATLICHPSRSQDVRAVVKQLSSKRQLAGYL